LGKVLVESQEAECVVIHAHGIILRAIALFESGHNPILSHLGLPRYAIDAALQIAGTARPLPHWGAMKRFVNAWEVAEGGLVQVVPRSCTGLLPGQGQTRKWRRPLGNGNSSLTTAR